MSHIPTNGYATLDRVILPEALHALADAVDDARVHYAAALEARAAADLEAGQRDEVYRQAVADAVASGRAASTVEDDRAGKVERAEAADLAAQGTRNVLEARWRAYLLEVRAQVPAIRDASVKAEQAAQAQAVKAAAAYRDAVHALSPLLAVREYLAGLEATEGVSTRVGPPARRPEAREVRWSDATGTRHTLTVGYIDEAVEAAAHLLEAQAVTEARAQARRAREQARTHRVDDDHRARGFSDARVVVVGSADEVEEAISE